MTGAIAGAARTLAGNETSDTRSKCQATIGAVANVAAAVSAVASARPRGSPRRSSFAPARAERQDRRDCREAHLPARIGGSAWIERERPRHGEPERIPAGGRPAGDRRGHSCRPHHAGALDGRTGSGKRHVQGDQEQHDEQPLAQAKADDGSAGESKRREQHHVLT
jgi:hypothetical protein